MLVVETIARIRREHFVKGRTIKEISRDLGISRSRLHRCKDDHRATRSPYSSL